MVIDVVEYPGGYKIKELVGSRDIYNPIQKKLVRRKGDRFFNVYSPKGEMILGNRHSLEEAKRDMELFIGGGGEEAYQEVPWKGSTIKLLSGGGEYHVSQIDKEIGDLVLDLNFYGFQTTGSCAGHYGLKRGFVNFSGILGGDEVKEVRKIFSKHGIKSVSVKDVPKSKLEDYTVVSFPSVAKR